ncbi:MAG: hypothetical protein ACKOX3_12465 [Bacteroidota bacterium]
MKKYFSIAFLFTLMACQSKLYMPLKEDRNYTQLMSGRNLYIQRCGSCHNLYLPKDYTSEKWLAIIQQMQVRAKINEEEKSLITQYLLHSN